MQKLAERSSADALHSKTESCLARLSIQTLSQSDCGSPSPSPVNSQASPKSNSLLSSPDDTQLLDAQQPSDVHQGKERKGHAPSASGAFEREQIENAGDEERRNSAELYLHAQSTIWLAGESLCMHDSSSADHDGALGQCATAGEWALHLKFSYGCCIGGCCITTTNVFDHV
jgi:hypothetical protein